MFRSIAIAVAAVVPDTDANRSDQDDGKSEQKAEKEEEFGHPLVVVGQVDGDVVLVMSNGAFGGIWEKLLVALEAAA